jgi:hypothetical protein
MEKFWEWEKLPCVVLGPEGFKLVPPPTGKPGRLGYQNLCRYLYGAPSLSVKEKAGTN